jgi:hypothetical protein
VSETVAIVKVESAGGKILKDEKGRVYCIFLHEPLMRAPLNAEDRIAQIDFTAFPHLTHLAIHSSAVTDRVIAQLRQLPMGMVEISISKSELTDKAVVSLIKERQALQIVSLQGKCATDLTLREAAKLVNLSTLAVISGNQITDEGIKALAKNKKIGFLAFIDTKITDAGWEEISTMTIGSLSFYGAEATDKGVSYISKLKYLRTFAISSTGISKDGLAFLRKTCPKLIITVVPEK